MKSATLHHVNNIVNQRHFKHYKNIQPGIQYMKEKVNYPTI